MRNYVFLFFLLFLTGCSSEEIYLAGSSSQSSINDFSNLATSGSLVFSSDPKSINCSVNLPATEGVQFNGSDWILGCFNFRDDICTQVNTSNIQNYSGTGAQANTVLNVEFDTDWGSMCCNVDGALCVPAVFNGSFHSCEGVFYEELTPVISFNNVSSKWEVVSCIKGLL